MKNKYARRSRISEAKTRQIVRFFAADLTAAQTAELTGLNRNTVNRFYRALRERILTDCERRRPAFAGANDRNPAQGNARPVPAACNGAIVFGIFDCDGRVYTEVVPDESKATLRGMIRGKVDRTTVTSSDDWPGYHGLVDLGHGHYRVDHAGHETAGGRTPINGIEGFWGLAKVRFEKFKGVPAATFHLHLKETEWRYNHRARDKYKLLLCYLRENPVT